MDISAAISIMPAFILTTAVIAGSIVPIISISDVDVQEGEIGLSESDIALLSEEINDMLNDTIKDITTYIQCKHIFGAFDRAQQDYPLTRLAVLITPLYDTPLFLSDIDLVIITRNDIIPLMATVDAHSMGGYPLFADPIWNETSAGSYSIAVFSDDDGSISSLGEFNDPGDAAYLLIRLPESCRVKSRDDISIYIVPEYGTQRMIDLEVPLATKSVVKMYPN